MTTKELLRVCDHYFVRLLKVMDRQRHICSLLYHEISGAHAIRILLVYQSVFGNSYSLKA